MLSFSGIFRVPFNMKYMLGVRTHTGGYVRVRLET